MVKFLKRTFLIPFLLTFVVFLLTRNISVRVGLQRTMRKIFNVKTVVVPMDNGLNDQIGCWGYGEWVRTKCRLPVKYASGWFEKNGRDLDGHFQRTFQLKDAFPSIELRWAGVFENWLYRTFFRYNRNGGQPWKTRYTLGIHALKDKFHPVGLDTCKDLLNDINAHKSCAVHVRRGDYAHGVLGTHPTQAEFFIFAIRKIGTLDPNVKFFFFSEEPEWIREKILPALDKNIQCRVCDRNDSSKGYLDLYLISRCDHVICSLGGFGHAGRLFSYKKGYYLRGTASDEWHFDWSLKTYDGEQIRKEIEKGSADIRETGTG